MTDPELVRPPADERARWAELPPMRIAIERQWGNDTTRPDGPTVGWRAAPGELHVSIDAPYHADPPPRAPPGSLDGLWEYEVVELFLLGSDERYLELEFGPHGHYLALQLEGVRNIRQRGMLLPYAANIHGARWLAQARVPFDWLPPGLSRFNAYAIDGVSVERRYWAYSSVAGTPPDFHRLEAFSLIEDVLAAQRIGQAR